MSYQKARQDDNINRNKSKNCCSTAIDYLRNEENAVTLKAVIFNFSAGAVCVFPFFTLQMQLYGLSIEEIGLIFLLVPIGSLLGPVTSGMIADRTGKFNLVVAGNILFTMLLFSCLLLVPFNIDNISFNCSSSGISLMNIDQCHECLIENEKPVTILVKDCIYQEHVPVINSTICVDEDICETIDKEMISFYENNTQINITINSETNLDNEGTCNAAAYNISAKNTSLPMHLLCEQNLNIVCRIDDISNCPYKKSKSFSKTFYLFLFFMFTGHFAAASGFTMLDATIIAAAQKHNLHLGRQKILAMIAFGVMPLIAGGLVQYHSLQLGYRSYLSAFLLGGSFSIVAFFIMLFTKITVAKNEENLLLNLRELVRRPEVDLFFLVVLILGTNFGFIESYLFLYLIEELQAPPYLLGLTMTVGNLSSIPMLFWSEWFENKVGRHNVFLICFTAYAIRMVGYSFIINPYTALVFELFESITYQLMYVTCLRLCPILATKGMLATMTGMMGAIHYSFGKGIGGFTGGYIIGAIGIRNAFRVFGGMALSGGILYFCLHHCYLKDVIAQKEKEFLERQRQEKENTKKLELNQDGMNYEGSESQMKKSVLSLSGCLREDIHKSLLALSTSGAYVPNYDLKKRHSRCISYYDNLTDDFKLNNIGEFKNFNINKKEISKSAGNLLT